MSMTKDDELSCQQVVELVTDYLEQALLPQRHKQFEEHVTGCPECDAYIEQVRQTIRILRRVSEEPVFPTTKHQLRQRFREWIADGTL